MTAAVWPQTGRCGSCAQPARRFPSGQWEHIALPCRARVQHAWGVDDAALVQATFRFIPAGEPLPAAPDGWRAWMRRETGGAS